MVLTHRWRKEPGARLEGSRALDRDKVQAPGIVRLSSGGFRLFYTALGPAKPFRTCQGYILSAVSDDGLTFRKEPGIRLAPWPDVPHMSLRLIAPTVTPRAEGGWRMYFEARGPADRPTVICSAVSSDMLRWEFEDGIRLQRRADVRTPRYTALPDGRGRLWCIATEAGGPDVGASSATAAGRSDSVVSAVSSNGIDFEFEPGHHIRGMQAEYDSAGITAGEVIPPAGRGDRWTMFYSAWQDVPAGTATPLHPSADADAVADGGSEDFAAASIASDMAGYRSRIFVAWSCDGVAWERGPCVIEGAGHDGEGLDAVHAEDMSLVRINKRTYRMYYAACDRDGRWRIASAVNVGALP